MKLSLSIFERSAKPIQTGSVLRSPVITPVHAKAIREVQEFNQRQMRMYDAAVTNNLNADMPGTYGSANAEIMTSRYIARARARSAVKDFPTAKGALRTMRNNIVGDDPFKLEMQAGKKNGEAFEFDTAVNTEIEDAWKEAGLPENCDTRGEMSRFEMYHCVCASIKRDGGILARHHSDYPFNKFKYALELLEIDRLQDQYCGKAQNGNVIRFSIERDPKYLRPQAYWLLSRHPGDPFQFTGSPNNFRIRIPADEIIHFSNLKDRAEQDVGMTEFDAAIQQLHRIRQWDIAYVTAAISNASNPLFFVKKIATGLQYSGDPAMSDPIHAARVDGGTGGVNADDAVGGSSAPGGPAGSGANKHRIQSPGMAEELDWGLEPMQMNPKFPIEAGVGFTKNNLEQTSVGLGLSYAEISGDFSNMSFSAARMAMLPQRRNFKVDQQHMILSFVRLHFNAWLKAFLLSGETAIPFSRYYELCGAAKFQGEQWDYINPMQDVQADVIAIEANIKSRDEVINSREGGGKFETTIAKIAAEKKLAEKQGIDLTQDATTPTLKKGEPGQTEPPKS